MEFIQFIYFYISLCTIGINAWREASKCTVPSTNPTDTNTSDESNDNLLKLDCQSDLIFIAWSHYGHQTRPKSTLKPSNDSCYFSSRDCIVSVDYVANECNGQTSCRISLDSQYLHSCKSYSDYLFIIYDCVKSNSIVNICDKNVNIELNDDTTTSDLESIYLQTPNYPNEYNNNLECNCYMKHHMNKSVQIELLEFDLESSNDQTPYSSLITDLSLFDPRLQSRGFNDYSSDKSNNYCMKDYLGINGNTKLCGTLSPFSSLLNIQKQDSMLALGKQSNKSPQRLINFKLLSDDALTRRGFWLKLKVSNMNNLDCPDNFLLINNMCIRIFNEQLTWYEAHNYCAGLGYTLAVFDNFEMEKQLNKALFGDEDESEIPIVSNSQSKLISSSLTVSSKSLKKFWIGIRHLNQTNWFDYKNELINFRSDEKAWWPWLIVDSTTYNQGSCVGKKKNWFFLEDCYKRMPFACQYKSTKKFNPQKEKMKTQLTCGKMPVIEEDIPITTTQTSTTTSTVSTTTATTQSTTTKSNIIYQTKAKINQMPIQKDEFLDANTEKLKLLVKNSQFGNNNDSGSNNSGPDSNLLITLVFIISLLIASVNMIVIILLCKRRKLSSQQKLTDNLKTDSSTIKSSKESKTSSHNTINIDDINNFNSALNSSLSFNCLTNDANNLFMTSCNKNGYRNAHLSTLIPVKTLINVQDFNQIHQQQQINSYPQQNGHKANNNVLINDALGHIYETISVSSASNGNIPALRYNTNYLCLANQQINTSRKNQINDFDLLNQVNQQNQHFQIQQGYAANDNLNDLSLTDSSLSQKSQDGLLINTNRSVRNNKKYQFKPINCPSSNQVFDNSHLNTQYRFSTRNSNMFSDTSNSTNASSPSCSSSVTTTLTDIGVGNSNKFDYNNQKTIHQKLPNNAMKTFTNNNLNPVQNLDNSNNYLNQHLLPNCDEYFNNNSINQHQSQFIKASNNINQLKRQQNINDPNELFASRIEAVV